MKAVAITAYLQRSNRCVALLVLALGLISCAVGPNYTRPALHTPKVYIDSEVTSSETQRFLPKEDIPAEWWALFHSKPLNDLVVASFRYNSGVEAAKASLRAALETAYAERGALYPLVGLSFAPTKQQTAGLLTSVLASNQYNYSLYTGQVFVSYTPDVFGGTRRQLESLVAQAQSQRLQLEATYLTLASNVVNAAIQEASLSGQIGVTQRMIHSQKQILNIMHKQQKLGDEALAGIAMQEASLAASEATLPPLEKQWALQRNVLNALTGRFPDERATPTFVLHSLVLPSKVPLSLPSALIEHRPDIRAAEEQMHAANALIGVAISNRLPNVTLGFTNAGAAATNLSDLFQPNTTFWALAGLISQPVFDAGTLKHRQRFAQAMYAQAAAQYKLTVINAFQNVADTLKSMRADARAYTIARHAKRAAWTSLRIARQQWASGDISPLVLLTNEQLYQQASLNVIQAEANRLSDTVALFQALGGGWWQKKPACLIQ